MSRKRRRDALRRRAQARINASARENPSLPGRASTGADPEPPGARENERSYPSMHLESDSQDGEIQEVIRVVQRDLSDPKNWGVIGGRSPDTAQDVKKVLQNIYDTDSIEVIKIGDEPHGGERFSLKFHALRVINKNYRAALRLKNQGDMSGALNTIDRALQEMPDSVEIRSNRNAILMGLHRMDEAREGCRKILEVDPEHEHSHQNMGAIMVEAGKLSEAASHYDKAIKSNKKHDGEAEHLAHSYCEKSNVLFEMESFKEALIECDNALRTNPDHVPAYRKKAQILMNIGDIAGAKEWIRKAVKMERE